MYLPNHSRLPKQKNVPRKAVDHLLALLALVAGEHRTHILTLCESVGLKGNSDLPAERAALRRIRWVARAYACNRDQLRQCVGEAPLHMRFSGFEQAVRTLDQLPENSPYVHAIKNHASRCLKEELKWLARSSYYDQHMMRHIYERQCPDDSMKRIFGNTMLEIKMERMRTIAQENFQPE